MKTNNLTDIKIAREELEKNMFTVDGKEYSKVTVKTPTMEEIRLGAAIEYAENWFAVEDYETVLMCRKGLAKDVRGGILHDGMSVVLETGEEVEITKSEILRRAELFLEMELDTIRSMREIEDENRFNRLLIQ